VLEGSIVQEAHASASYSTPRPVTARDALAEELDRTAGAISYLSEMLDRFPEPPAAWLSVFITERQHLARVADRLLTQQVKVADLEAEIRAKTVEALQVALVGIIQDLGANPDSEAVREIVALHLRRASGVPAPARRPAEPVRPPLAPPPLPADF
jgi:hypothetical protein